MMSKQSPVCSDSRYIRIQARNVRRAGFHPGDKLTVVRNGSTFSITRSSSTKRKSTGSNFYPVRVEKDGRVRILKSILREELGMQAKRKNPQSVITRGSISVSY